MYRAILVDDENPSLQGLSLLVPWESFGIEVFGATQQAEVALGWLTRNAIDILVSDIKMPGISGLDLYSRGKEFNPDLQAIFISGHADFSYVKRALEERAVGYILKPLDDSEVAEAIRKVVFELNRIRNEVQASDGVVSPVTSLTAQSEKPSRNRLVVRDIKRVIEEELESGVSLKELADRFGMTANHLGHVFFASTGAHFSEYLTRRRMERARILLKNSQLKIFEVAYRLGYRTISHFNRVFKDRYGLTPGEYRDGAILKKN